MVENLQVDKELNVKSKDFANDDEIHFERYKKIFSDIPKVRYVTGDEEARKKIKIIKSTSRQLLSGGKDLNRLSFDSVRESTQEWEYLRINHKLEEVKGKAIQYNNALA